MSGRGSGLRRLSRRSAQIADLIHEITVERGLDPRDFVLHSFGGSCGMLAGMFGAELNVKQIVVPYTASVNCAFGLVSADIVHEYSTTAVLPAPSPAALVNAVFEPMVAKARRQLKKKASTGPRFSSIGRSICATPDRFTKSRRRYERRPRSTTPACSNS